MYDVFIEGPVDRSPAGQAKLASAIAQRFRLPEAQVQGYLAGGKLKAKTNVDEATARALAAQLEQLGAVVSIVDKATGVALPRGSGTIQSQPPPVNPSAPVPVPAGAPPRYESGLAAAFSPQAAQASLGALESLAVSSLDGSVDEPPPKPTPPPPHRAAAAASPPPAPAPPAAKKAMAPSSTRDPFAAPLDADEAPLELAESPAKPPPKAKTALPEAPPPPPHAATPATTPPAPRPSGNVAPVPAGEPVGPPRKKGIDGVRQHFEDHPRHRLAAGLVLGLAIGFLPAHVYATIAEDKYDRINSDLAHEPAPATQAEYEILMQQYDYTVKRLHNERIKIAITTGLIWALLGSGVGFAWFRYVIPQP